jgi:hypothetical protein
MVTDISAPGGALVVVVVGDVVVVLVVGEVLVVEVAGSVVVVVVEAPGIDVVVEIAVEVVEGPELVGGRDAVVVVERGTVVVGTPGTEVVGGDAETLVVAEGEGSEPPFATTTPPTTPPATIPTIAVAPIPLLPAATMPAATKPGGKAGAPARTAATTMSGTFPWNSASRGSLRRHSSLSETSGAHSRVRAVSKVSVTASM